MHLVKPNWVTHIDDSRPTKPSLTLYALDVHPDGTRLATGGLDSIIRVWSVGPVVDPELELKGEEACPRLLCTLTSHTGPVMTLKWSNSGAFLASGSDDGAVLVWQHDGSKGGKVWGSDTTNVENWKATRRLVGHQSDVANVAWSPDDSFLASVGLDNQVLIWSGRTFDLVRKLPGHVGFVKGVVFDPVGQFLATQSDDNSLKVWRTTDWGLEADVKEAFMDAPKSNVTRPAWSPDGAHLVTPNSMNGPVFVAGVISRLGWRGGTSLIGHPDIVQVASYNPLLFLRDPTKPPDATNIATLVAISARSSISFWFSDMNHPFVVLEEVFDRDVLDMCWSKDGLQLWACSSEGHVSVATFSLAEFPTVAPSAARDAILSSYGFVPPKPLPPSRPISSLSSQPNGTSGTAAQPNKLVARKGPNAKRPRLVQPVAHALVQPQPLATPAQSTTAAAFANAPTYNAPSSLSAATSANAFASTSAAQHPAYAPPTVPQTAFGSAPPPLAHSTSDSRKRKASAAAPSTSDDSAYTPYPPWAIPSPADQPGYGAPRLSSADYRLKGHTLYVDPSTAPRPEPVVLAPAYCLRDREPTFAVTNGLEDGQRPGKGQERILQVPEIRSWGRLGVEDSDAKDTFEWRNFGDGDRKGQAEVRVFTTKKTLWTDYLPNWVVVAAGSPVFTAVSCEDASLVTWSPTGRRLMPTLVLDAPCSFLVAEGSFLLAITARGTLTVWNLSPSIPRPRSIYPPLSISSLVASSSSPKHPTPSITSSSLLPNGTPVIALSSGSTFSYDSDLASWTRVCEPWWAGSDAWEGRRGRNANASSVVARGIVRNIEGAVNDIVVDQKEKETAAAVNGGTADVDDTDTATKPAGEPSTPQGTLKEFSIALVLSHLETRIKAAAALDSPSEYRSSLLQYTRELAKEGLRSKAEELIKELLGPIYHKPGRVIEEEWTPTVVGLSKRELLRDVLRELAKDRVTKMLVDEYQKIVKEVMSS
ncbi:hypothetical protein JCM10212_000976 [Sporobolomyces blumeae]